MNIVQSGPPQRKSPRLQGYDYSQSGSYFVTICTYERLHRFGRIEDGQMILNDLGRVVEDALIDLPTLWNTIEIDSFVIMPNHLHAIITLSATAVKPPQLRTPTLGQIIGAFKAGITRTAREHNLLLVDTESERLWQGRYHDHIIRDERTFNKIQTYIAENPAHWADDTFFNAI
jgi:putative transposase